MVSSPRHAYPPWPWLAPRAAAAGLRRESPRCARGARPGTVHVDASYSGPDPSDGTAAHPYLTVQEGVAAAPAGGHLIVLPGEYVEDVDIAKALRVEGQCPALVTIRGTTAIFAVDIFGTGLGRVELRGVTVAGAAGGIRVRQRQDVLIEDVVVRDCGSAVRHNRFAVALEEGADPDIRDDTSTRTTSATKCRSA